MTTEAKFVSIKLPSALAARSEALKEKTGISEAAILRQAISAGLSKVEAAIELLHEEDFDPAGQFAADAPEIDPNREQLPA